MPTTAITGKQVTFTFATVEGSAQVTTATIDKQAASSTIQTLAGSVVVAQGIETTVSADYLFDGNQVGGGFHAALDAALQAGLPGTVQVDADGAQWVGEALVTGLSTETPADDAVTCSATLVISGDFPFTAPVALLADDSL